MVDPEAAAVLDALENRACPQCVWPSPERAPVRLYLVAEDYDTINRRRMRQVWQCPICHYTEYGAL